LERHGSAKETLAQGTDGDYFRGHPLLTGYFIQGGF
jgi:hypothetical protein